MVDEELTPERFIYFGSEEYLLEFASAYLAIAWIDTWREMRTDVGYYAVLGDDRAGCLEKFGKEASTRQFGYFSPHIEEPVFIELAED